MILAPEGESCELGIQKEMQIEKHTKTNTILYVRRPLLWDHPM